MRLESSGAKLGRADEHLKLLDKKVKRFLKGDPYPVTKKFDSKNSRYVFTAKRLREPPEFTWGLIIGDCVHNFRSALDHAVWEMSERFSGPSLADTRTQFPIDSNRFRNDQVARIGPCAKALIQWLQPGNTSGWYGEALERLNALDIADKHKLTTVAGAVTEASRIHVNKPPNTHLRWNWNPSFGGFRDGAQIGDFRILSTTPPIPHSQVKVNEKITFGIAFGQGSPLEGELVVPCLKALSRATSDIIAMFELTSDVPAR